jgi:DNA-binding HxlR family transcriptional regulator
MEPAPVVTGPPPTFACPVEVPLRLLGGKWKLILAHLEVPPTVVYELDPGEADRLAPLLEALCDWGCYRAARTGAEVGVGPAAS